MTEAEAAEKWCPFVRFNDSGANRWTQHDTIRLANTNCIGSRCMAWRTAAVVPNVLVQIPNADPPRYEPMMTAYCGLAGKP